MALHRRNGRVVCDSRDRRDLQKNRSAHETTTRSQAGSSGACSRRPRTTNEPLGRAGLLRKMCLPAVLDGRGMRCRSSRIQVSSVKNRRKRESPLPSRGLLVPSNPPCLSRRGCEPRGAPREEKRPVSSVVPNTQSSYFFPPDDVTRGDSSMVLYDLAPFARNFVAITETSPNDSNGSAGALGGFGVRLHASVWRAICIGTYSGKAGCPRRRER